MSFAKSVYEYAHRELDPVGADLIMQKGKENEWKGGMNPERTENWGETHSDGSAKYGGDLAFLDVSKLEEFTKKFNLGEDVIQGLALLINHAAGHSSGMNHYLSGEWSKNTSYIMDDAKNIATRIQNSSVEELLSPKNNKDFIKAIIGRFNTDGKAKDNYYENDKKKSK